MNESGPLQATVRRQEGQILIVAFDDAAPPEWRAPGTLLSVRHPDTGAGLIGRILPVGSRNRLVMRAYGTQPVFRSGERVSVARDVPDAPVPEALHEPDAADYRNVTFVTGPPDPQKVFSVFTLVKSESSYRRALKAFAERGFTEENTEFIALDNRETNHFDGYRAARFARTHATGRYVMLCHDDIEPVEESFDDLVAHLEALEALDPHWMVAGVAGGRYRASERGRKQTVVSRISDRWGPARRVGGPFPQRVESLDECLLIFPRDRMPQSSVSLGGFHFFATDLCLQAELAGGTAYVVDFHVFHYGAARKDETYYRLQQAMTDRYRPFFPGRYVGTTTKPLDFD